MKLPNPTPDIYAAMDRAGVTYGNFTDPKRNGMAIVSKIRADLLAEMKKVVADHGERAAQLAIEEYKKQEESHDKTL